MRLTEEIEGGGILCNTDCPNLEDCYDCDHFHKMLERLNMIENDHHIMLLVRDAESY